MTASSSSSFQYRQPNDTEKNSAKAFLKNDNFLGSKLIEHDRDFEDVVTDYFTSGEHTEEEKITKLKNYATALQVYYFPENGDLRRRIDVMPRTYGATRLAYYYSMVLYLFLIRTNGAADFNRTTLVFNANARTQTILNNAIAIGVDLGEARLYLGNIKTSLSEIHEFFGLVSAILQRQYEGYVDLSTLTPSVPLADQQNLKDDLRTILTWIVEVRPETWSDTIKRKARLFLEEEKLAFDDVDYQQMSESIGVVLNTNEDRARINEQARQDSKSITELEAMIVQLKERVAILSEQPASSSSSSSSSSSQDRRPRYVDIATANLDTIERIRTFVQFYLNARLISRRTFYDIIHWKPLKVYTLSSFYGLPALVRMYVNEIRNNDRIINAQKTTDEATTVADRLTSLTSPPISSIGVATALNVSDHLEDARASASVLSLSAESERAEQQADLSGTRATAATISSRGTAALAELRQQRNKIVALEQTNGELRKLLNDERSKTTDLAGTRSNQSQKIRIRELEQKLKSLQLQLTDKTTDFTALTRENIDLQRKIEEEETANAENLRLLAADKGIEIQALVEEKDKRQADYDRLLSQKTRIDGNLSEMRARNKELEERLNVIDLDLQRSSSELVEAQKNIQVAQNEALVASNSLSRIEELNDEIASLTERLNGERIRYNELIETSKQTIVDLDEQFAKEKDNLVQEQSAKVAELEREIAACRTTQEKLDAAEKAARRAGKELTAFASSQAQKEAEIRALTNEKTQIEQRLSDTINNVDTVNREVAALQSELSTRDREIIDLNGRLTAQLNYIPPDQHSDEIADLEARYRESLDNAKRNYEDQLQRARADYDALNREKTTIDEDQRAFQKEQDALNATIAAQSSTILDQQANIDDITEQLEAIRKQLVSLNAFHAQELSEQRRALQVALADAEKIQSRLNEVSDDNEDTLATAGVIKNDMETQRQQPPTATPTVVMSPVDLVASLRALNIPEVTTALTTPHPELPVVEFDIMAEREKHRAIIEQIDILSNTRAYDAVHDYILTSGDIDRSVFVVLDKLAQFVALVEGSTNSRPGSFWRQTDKADKKIIHDIIEAASSEQDYSHVLDIHDFPDIHEVVRSIVQRVLQSRYTVTREEAPESLFEKLPAASLQQPPRFTDVETSLGRDRSGALAYPVNHEKVFDGNGFLREGTDFFDMIRAYVLPALDQPSKGIRFSVSHPPKDDNWTVFTMNTPLREVVESLSDSLTRELHVREVNRRRRRPTRLSVRKLLSDYFIDNAVNDIHRFGTRYLETNDRIDGILKSVLNNGFMSAFSYCLEKLGIPQIYTNPTFYSALHKNDFIDLVALRYNCIIAPSQVSRAQGSTFSIQAAFSNKLDTFLDPVNRIAPKEIPGSSKVFASDAPLSRTAYLRERQSLRALTYDERQPERNVRRRTTSYLLN